MWGELVLSGKNNTSEVFQLPFEFLTTDKEVASYYLSTRFIRVLSYVELPLFPKA
jgi:hypothetical protein